MVRCISIMIRIISPCIAVSTMRGRQNFGEAKARYTSAAISGTVMMLSEDFGEKGIFRNEDQENARIRAQELCSQREIQKIAASGISFRPAESAGTGASSWYTAQIHGQKYVAVFHLKKTPASYVFDLEEEGVGGSRRLNSGQGATYKIEDWKAALVNGIRLTQQFCY